MRQQSDPPLRILVVENYPDTLHYLTLFLEDQGHTVVPAMDMAGAMAAFPGSDADVLICDIGLPDGDGWELMERLQTDVFAIAITGYGTHGDRERSRAAGFREHLTKPFKLAALAKILHEAAEEKLGQSSDAR